MRQAKSKAKPKAKVKQAASVEPVTVCEEPASMGWPTDDTGRPLPPEHLSQEAQDWWRWLTAEYELEDSALMVLRKMLEAHDIGEMARREVEKYGVIVHDRYSNPKVNPAVNVQRDARAEFRAGFVKLGLNLEPVGGIGRPSGS